MPTWDDPEETFRDLLARRDVGGVGRPARRQRGAARPVARRAAPLGRARHRARSTSPRSRRGATLWTDVQRFLARFDLLSRRRWRCRRSPSAGPFPKRDRRRSPSRRSAGCRSRFRSTSPGSRRRACRSASPRRGCRSGCRSSAGATPTHRARRLRRLRGRRALGGFEAARSTERLAGSTGVLSCSRRKSNSGSALPATRRERQDRSGRLVKQPHKGLRSRKERAMAKIEPWHPASTAVRTGEPAVGGEDMPGDGEWGLITTTTRARRGTGSRKVQRAYRDRQRSEALPDVCRAGLAYRTRDIDGLPPRPYGGPCGPLPPRPRPRHGAGR